MWRRLAWTVALLCAVSTKGMAEVIEGVMPDATLEAKAKAGDAPAACELVAADLLACTSARDRWLQGESVEAPGCLADAVPWMHEQYFSEAVANLPDTFKPTGEDVRDGLMAAQNILRSDPGQGGRADYVANLADAGHKMCKFLGPCSVSKAACPPE